MFQSFVIGSLVSTLVLKLGALVQGPRFLDEVDPVFPVSIRTMTIVGVLLEALLVAAVIKTRSRVNAAFWTLGFLLSAGIYRIGIKIAGGSHCKCLGQLTSWIPSLMPYEEGIVNTLALGMGIAAVTVLVFEKKMENKGGSGALRLQ